MRRAMTRFPFWIFLAFLPAPFGAAGEEQNPIHDSSLKVRPLLVGARVPELTLRTADSLPFDLGAAIAGRQSILIFYRGGW